MPERRKWIDIGIGAGVVAVIIVVVVVILVLRSGGSESSGTSITVERVVNRVDTDRPRQDGGQPPNFLSARVGQELIPETAF
ncbi:MAG: hypothetical protein CMJ45_03475 [Planctomyces sp.]|nr:hypothetical protein [Planctomyces sp.]